MTNDKDPVDDRRQSGNEPMKENDIKNIIEHAELELEKIGPHFLSDTLNDIRHVRAQLSNPRVTSLTSEEGSGTPEHDPILSISYNLRNLSQHYDHRNLSPIATQLCHHASQRGPRSEACLQQIGDCLQQMEEILEDDIRKTSEATE